MNKKRIIVLWVAGVLASLVLILKSDDSESSFYALLIPIVIIAILFFLSSGENFQKKINKKQKAVVWFSGISVAGLLPSLLLEHLYPHLTELFFGKIMPILIISSLLFFTLADRKSRDRNISKSAGL